MFKALGNVANVVLQNCMACKVFRILRLETAKTDVFESAPSQMIFVQPHGRPGLTVTVDSIRVCDLNANPRNTGHAIIEASSIGAIGPSMGKNVVANVSI